MKFEYVCLKGEQMNANNKVKETLLKNGKNISKYASLEGLNNFSSQKQQLFGKKSFYYGSIMEDGFIFNPYVHRRFLPTQFKRIVRFNFSLEDIKNNTEEDIYEQLASVSNCFCGYFSIGHIIKYMEKEIHTLLILQEKDTSAYMERSKFLNVETVLSTIKGILDLCKSYGVSHYGLGRMIEAYDRLAQEPTLTILEKFLITNYFPYKHIDCPREESLREIRESFFKSGLYFSIKNELMFNLSEEKIKDIYGTNKFDSLEGIRESLLKDKFDFKSYLIKYIRGIS